MARKRYIKGINNGTASQHSAVKAKRRRRIADKERARARGRSK